MPEALQLPVHTGRQVSSDFTSDHGPSRFRRQNASLVVGPAFGFLGTRGSDLCLPCVPGQPHPLRTRVMQGHLDI